MKDNKFDDRYSFQFNFMIYAVSGLELTDKMKEHPRKITMQLNGEEIDPERALDRLDKAIPEYVEERAKEIIEDKIMEILSPFEDRVAEIADDLRTIISTKIKELL